ncbi:hypothetical protein OHB12_03725 [Nocardia sp. NBC_01730]|uniref:group II intron maturase-specific domain-containing protein n=1 Tax=Nocardia sp. NBC_01730 TaxID=2975998 RepID=UPI002E11DC14|nr:hypothetical protein OHB12_03725 [Nocardia sp. NBC_01730]
MGFSPLLANIALAALDEHFDQQWRELMGTNRRRATRKRKGLGNWRIVRFADDFVLMVSGDRHHAEAVQSIKGKVREKANRSTLHHTLDELVNSLNRTLRGWANHFRYGVSKQVFHAIDHITWRRIAKWLHNKNSRLKWSELRRRFCRPGTWIIDHNGVVFTGASSVKVTRYRYRGNTIPTPWTPKPAVTAIGA